MFYIYCITNKINGKTYIGQRKCPIDKTPETDKYMGSGVHLKRSEEKYGLENFSKEILAITETKENADILEKVFIKLYRDAGKAEYNIAKGGEGGYVAEFMTEEQKQKYFQNLSKSLKGHKISQETRRKISNSNKGVSRNKGVVRNNETRLKISNSKRNVKIKLSEKELKRRRDFFKENNPSKNRNMLGKNNPHFGKIVSSEQKKRQSEKMKCRHWFNDGVVTISAFECPEGFVKGRLNGGRK